MRPPHRAAAPVVPAVVVIAAALGFAALAGAADTQWWILSSPADHAKSEVRGVVVGPDGTLALGPEARRSPAESLQVIWALAPLPDGSVAVAGDRGRIGRWTESGGLKPWVRLPAGQVLALAFANGELVAGTGPGGLIYRVSLSGDTTLLARTGERYVWGLAPAGKGEWLAATGTRGRLLRIRGGKSEILLDTDESNLVSIVPDGKGGAYAGGDSHGRIVHVPASGQARTVFDAAEDEVRALAIGPDHALYAAALSATAVSTDDEDAGVQPAKSPVSGGRAVVYRVVPDSLAATYWTSPQPFVFALLGQPGGVLAGTGSRGALYRIERANGATQWLGVAEGQITALASGSGGRIYAASSNPGAVWRLGPDRSKSGELTSPVLDARRIAQFGRIGWHGSAGGGKVELFTRSGNTDPPDTTWSRWEGGAASTDGRRSAAPPGRYFQWRLGLQGGDPRVESVEAAWRERNLPPRIEELQVAPQGQGFREGELTPRSDAVTQTLPGGQKVEYSMQSPTTARALRELPMWARGLRTIQWKGFDPNGDALRYRVDVREEGGKGWIEVGKDLDATSFTWDTNGLPDGRFRLRVQASDAASNAVGEEGTDEVVSEPFTVDNTPPAIGAFDARAASGAIDLSGRAEDSFSPISRVEVSLDDDDWRAVTPEGGLADERAVSFRARLPDVDAGDHTVAVRAVDLAGNSTLRSARVQVGARR